MQSGTTRQTLCQLRSSQATRHLTEHMLKFPCAQHTCCVILCHEQPDRRPAKTSHTSDRRAALCGHNCLHNVTGLASWATQYNTWLLIKLAPRGTIFSFLSLDLQQSFESGWRKLHRGQMQTGGCRGLAWIAISAAFCWAARTMLLCSLLRAGMCCDVMPIL